MKGLDFYIPRAKQAIKDGVVEHEKGGKRAIEIIKEIPRQKGKYYKFLKLVSFLSELTPDNILSQLQKKLDDKDFGDLPFDPNKYKIEEKIGHGGISKVYLLESKDKDGINYVIKLDYVHKGDIDKLQKQARKEHDEFEQTQLYYSELPDLIPNEVSIITTATKDQQPIIATLQQYLGHSLKDVFTEIRKDELIFLLEENKGLKEEFIIFVNTSLRLLEEKGMILDLMGDKNLSIIKLEDKYHLRFIDPHNNCVLKTEPDKGRIERTKELLGYLEEIKKSLK